MATRPISGALPPGSPPPTLRRPDSSSALDATRLFETMRLSPTPDSQSSVAAAAAHLGITPVDPDSHALSKIARLAIREADGSFKVSKNANVVSQIVIYLNCSSNLEKYQQNQTLLFPLLGSALTPISKPELKQLSNSVFKAIDGFSHSDC